MLSLAGLCRAEGRQQNGWIGQGERPYRCPDERVLPFRNGLLDTDARLNGDPEYWHPATPEFFNTSCPRYGFDPHADRPVNWLTLLGALPVTPSSAVRHQIWPHDPQSILALQEWFGLHLIYDTSYQKILAMIGPRRSGKGTIATILMEMIGVDSVAGPTLDDLGEKFGLEPLIGKRAAIIDDMRIGPGTDLAKATERLLSISGQGLLSTPRKGISHWIGKHSARITILSNDIPKFDDQSSALPGRFIVLRMVNSFYGQEDRELVDKLLPEMPGILNWAMEGLKRLRANGRFTQPESGENIVQRMVDSNHVRSFARERCRFIEGVHVLKQDLYDAWVAWCVENKIKDEKAGNSFGREFKKVYMEFTNNPLKDGRMSYPEDRPYYWKGVALN